LYCTKCGNKISDKAAFCGYCGNKINVSQEREQEDTEKSFPNVITGEVNPNEKAETIQKHNRKKDIKRNKNNKSQKSNKRKKRLAPLLLVIILYATIITGTFLYLYVDLHGLETLIFYDHIKRFVATEILWGGVLS